MYAEAWNLLANDPVVISPRQALFPFTPRSVHFPFHLAAYGHPQQTSKCSINLTSWSPFHSPPINDDGLFVDWLGNLDPNFQRTCRQGVLVTTLEFPQCVVNVIQSACAPLWHAIKQAAIDCLTAANNWPMAILPNARLRLKNDHFQFKLDDNSWREIWTKPKLRLHPPGRPHQVFPFSFA